MESFAVLGLLALIIGIIGIIVLMKGKKKKIR
ncbi:MAG: hypothetical protein K0S45_3287 [Nitrospira sp.]|jgi:hypothetical protein|nr:hypothetical protein [Nitrospira sp.]